MDKQLKPQLRFPEFDGVWKSVKLSNISNKVGYGIGSSAIQFDGVNQYLRITDIDESSNQFSPKPLTSPEGKIDEKYYLKKGDIVFARTGASVGKSYIYDENDGIIVFAGFLIRFSIIKAVPKFIFYNTLTSKYWKWVQVMSMRSGQPGLNAEELKSLKVNIPSLPEQQKIASFLTDVDNKINQLIKKKDLLEQYKKGIMQKIFSQELRFKDNEGNEFSKWEVKKLGELCDITTGKLDANAMVENGEYRFYTCAKDFFKIDEYSFDLEALLISGNGANVGYVHYYKGKFNAYQRTYVLYNLNQSYIFIKYFLDKFIQKRIHREKKDGNTPYIVMETLTEMIINVPSIEEQTKIGNFLSDIDVKIEALNTKIEHSKSFKKGLLQQMFV